MKKLLFVLAISGLVFSSCGNSTKKSAKSEETHQHEGCSHGHDHGDGHSHSHGDATHDHNTQEEFVVEENATAKKCCGDKKEAECKKECSKEEKKKCEGHDHDHSHEGHSH